MRTTVRSLAGVVGLVVAVAACGGAPAADTSTSSSSTPATTSTVPTTTTSPPAATTTSPDVEVGDLLVIGDWGSGTMPQGAVAGAMWTYSENNEVAAILTTGDNFYNDDFEFLMEPYGWVEDAGIPWWVTWGNHDRETPTRTEGVNDVFDDPPPWTVHEWGPVDVIILDSTQVESTEQADFFDEALSGSGRPTIVVFHHPRYSCGTATDTEDVAAWVSGFDDDVVLALSGHEHNYQRFEEGGVVYAVSGGGGAGLTELTPCPDGNPPLVAGESVHHFLTLSQSEDGLTVSAIDVNGSVIDQFDVALG